jgi:DNA-binding IclR family transcriptional regulator
MVADSRATAAQPTEGAQSVRRALAILRAVAAAQEHGVRLVDIVQLTGLNRPTVHRMLKVLGEEGAVEQDAQTRRYVVGPEVALLGLARGNRFPLRALADPYLRQLCDLVGDTVFLSVRHGLDSIGIDRKTGSYAIQVLSIEVGARRPLGAGVSGVAMLACLDEADVQSLLLANAKRLRLAGVDPAELAQRVQAARALGYAYAPHGVVAGTSAVAVPVQSASGELLGAISIAAMADRLQPQRLAQLVQSMLEHARHITRRHAETRARQSAVATRPGALSAD